MEMDEFTPVEPPWVKLLMREDVFEEQYIPDPWYRVSIHQKVPDWLALDYLPDAEEPGLDDFSDADVEPPLEVSNNVDEKRANADDRRLEPSDDSQRADEDLLRYDSGETDEGLADEGWFSEEDLPDVDIDYDEYDHEEGYHDRSDYDTGPLSDLGYGFHVLDPSGGLGDEFEQWAIDDQELNCDEERPDAELYDDDFWRVDPEESYSDYREIRTIIDLESQSVEAVDEVSQSLSSLLGLLQRAMLSRDLETAKMYEDYEDEHRPWGTETPLERVVTRSEVTLRWPFGQADSPYNVVCGRGVRIDW